MTEQAIASPPQGQVVLRQAEPWDLLHLAVERGFDPDQLSKIMDLCERRQRQLAEAAYNEDLRACQMAMPALIRDTLNKHTGKKYADFANLNAAIRPVYTAHGFAVSFGEAEEQPTPGKTRMFIEVMHKAGHARRYYGTYSPDDKGPQGSPNKTMVQAEVSSHSYARRDLTKLAFNLAEANEDQDGNSASQRIGEEQIAELNTLADQLEELIGRRSFQDWWPKCLAWLAVQNIGELPQRDFEKAKAEIKRNIAVHREGAK